MSHVFISYSTKNADYAEQLADKLRDEGFDVWIDRRRLRPAENWWQAIVRGLRGCAVLVVILTPESDFSKWVQREIVLAEKWNKPIFPLLLDGDTESDNWSIFVLTQYEDVRGGDLPHTKFYEALAEYIPRKGQIGTDIAAEANITLDPVTLDLDAEARLEMENPPPLDTIDTITHSIPMPSTEDVSAFLKRLFHARLAVIGAAVFVITIAGLLILLNLNNQLGSLGSSSAEIAFVSFRDGTAQIYVMDIDGSNPRNLTQNSATNYVPTWSPDGRRIAFWSNQDGNEEIYVMNADGSNPRNLSQNSANDRSPTWSPDGNQIAFSTNRDGDDEIYVMNADGSNPRNLTQNSAEDYTPSWSPNGNQIAFFGLRVENSGIYVMAADGSNSRNLTQNSTNDRSPVWSPEGSQIAFVSRQDGNDEIYVMAADGSNPRNLTQNSNDDWSPSWSPNGSQIVFASNRNGSAKIYVMNADGSNVRRLTNNSAYDTSPSWRPAPP